VIPVYVGRKFKVTVEGSVWQPVECEHCHIEWAFRVRVGGIGTGESPYMLDHDGAKKRAEERARRGLEEDVRLASEGVKRNVACPGCGLYQSDMVESLRKTHAGSWGALGLACSLVGFLLILRGLTADGGVGGEGSLWLACGAVPVAGGVASLLWRKRLQRRFDPNAKALRGAAGSPYRSGNATLHADDELADAPDTITRVQYDAACAEALAQGSEPPRPIPWRSAS